jgi:hypothetical protein
MAADLDNVVSVDGEDLKDGFGRRKRCSLGMPGDADVHHDCVSVDLYALECRSGHSRLGIDVDSRFYACNMTGVRAVRRGTGAILLAIAASLAACSTGSPNSALGADHGRTAASRYLAIATAGNERLETDIDGLSGHDRDRLSASAGDLRDASATERFFDRRLLMIAFAPAIKRTARHLYAVNQSRAELTAQAATSRSLGELRMYEAQIMAANADVETQVRLIRVELDLPPPMTS